MNPTEWMLIYIRLLGYVSVVLTSALIARKHCYGKLLMGNAIYATFLITTLIVTRFIDFHHKNDIATLLTTTGVILWAIFSWAEFITNGHNK